jgi:polysaccharide biosynthesis/export protein
MISKPRSAVGPLLVMVFLTCMGTQAVSASAATPGPVAADDRRLLQMGPGDQISVQVYGEPDMSSTVYVSDGGGISLPLVGTVAVGGLSPVEAAERVEKALKDGQFLNEPHVAITVIQGRSQRVTVLGEVKKPGRYPIDPNTNIFDLLAEAGGIAETGAQVIYIQRRQADGTETRLPIDLKAFGASPPSGSATLQPGDQIFVPVAEKFYIYGEVANPNEYRIEPGMTVTQAIARAGGVTIRGSARRVDIKREDKDHKFNTWRAKPDEPVLSNDVIHVKESIF